MYRRDKRRRNASKTALAPGLLLFEGYTEAGLTRRFLDVHPADRGREQDTWKADLRVP
jgi:hypothetical protein